MSPAAVAAGAYFRLREFVSGPDLTPLRTLFDSSWPHDWPHAIGVTRDSHTDVGISALAPIAGLMSGHGGLAHEQASPVNV